MRSPWVDDEERPGLYVFVTLPAAMIVRSLDSGPPAHDGIPRSAYLEPSTAQEGRWPSSKLSRLEGAVSHTRGGQQRAALKANGEVGLVTVARGARARVMVRCTARHGFLLLVDKPGRPHQGVKTGVWIWRSLVSLIGLTYYVGAGNYCHAATELI